MSSPVVHERHGDYGVVANDELPPGVGEYARTYNGDGWSVVRFDGDRIVEWIADDGGAPEDQTLLREWKWVTRALDAAYRRDRERLAAAVAEVIVRKLESIRVTHWYNVTLRTIEEVRDLAASPAELLARAEAVAKEKDHG